VPAEAVDQHEAVLVRYIVAEKDRHAARERPLLHEFLDCHAFVAAAGPQLEHHLAG
jgi:hypothetical protein